MTDTPKLRIQHCCHRCRMWEVRYRGHTLARYRNFTACRNFILSGDAAVEIKRLHLGDTYRQKWPP